MVRIDLRNDKTSIIPREKDVTMKLIEKLLT